MIKPQTDGRQVWDVVMNLHISIPVLIAHDLNLFALLNEQPLTFEEISQKLKLTDRATQVLISAACVTELIKLDHHHYYLTQVAKEYLLRNSNTSFCEYFDLIIDNADILSYSNFRHAILNDVTQVYQGQELFEVHEQENEKAKTFTKAMHSASIPAALAWPTALDLSSNRKMLDIGGGSGAHCIGATQQWTHLKASVLDLKPICEIALEFITEQNLQDRIDTVVGDMWKESFPEADLHFYSLIYHDWSPEECKFLTQKSFDSLEPGGRIIIHEWLFNNEKTGPFSAAAYNALMLLWCPQGQQYSGLELTQMLLDAGFIDIQIKSTFGYWSIVTGCKPA
ncbi:MAG: methyltransferase [Okeania sp. SIO3B5]|uniref:methyltransferase n=1 Tax=Okeania sp. SIO3B5 TaxID=2607811 RepID=UPI0014016304|nr:methyltransferase [Okeania sp. SIO3B5]NEO53484.1 methyltransferase [Okeania sp. SIO3B5]